MEKVKEAGAEEAVDYTAPVSNHVPLEQQECFHALTKS